MNSIFKKSVAVVLAVVMLMSVMSTAVFATTPWGQESTELVLDEQKTVTIEGGESKYFSFTPQKTGNYVFESFAEADAEAILYDEYNSQVGSEESDQDIDEYGNFRYEYYLTEGETYYLQVHVSNNYVDQVPVMVTKGSKTVYDIKLDDITIPAFKKGDWISNGDKYYYEYDRWFNGADTVTVVFSDESEQEYPLEFESEGSTRAWFEIGDKAYYIDFEWDQAYWSEDWLPGSTHTETVEWTYGESEFDVTIEDAKEMELGNDVTFDYVYGDDNAAYVITPEQSGLYELALEENAYTVMRIFNEEFEQLAYKYLGYDSNKNWNFYFKADETYYLSVERVEYFEGEEGGTLSISTQQIESPIKSITFKPISITEGTNYDTVYEEDKTYYGYAWWNCLSYEVEFTDGCKYSTSSASDVWHDCDGVYEEYEFLIDKTYPSYNKRWVAGNTYNVTVSFMGEDYTVPVTIEESPIVDVEFKPITVYEGLTDGYWTEFQQPDGEYVNGYHYNWQPKFKITMADGEIIEDQGDGFYYNDDWYYISTDDNQLQYNCWEVGQNYIAYAKFMGQRYEVPISVSANPVKKIEIEPITVERIKDGYWSLRWDEEKQEEVEFYRYSYIDKIKYKVTYNDNRVFTGTLNEDDSRIEFDGVSLYANVSDTQYQNPWTTGGTYDVTVEAGDYEIPVKVTVKEPTFPKIVLNQDTIVTTISGKKVYYAFTPSVDSTYYLESFSNGEGVDPQVTLYNADFQEINSDDDNGEDWDFKLECNLEAGKTYYFGIDSRYRSETITVKLTKFESPIKSITFAPLKLIEKVDGYYGEHEWFDYDYAGKLTYTVTYKDGRTITRTGLGYYDEHLDQWVYMDWADNQHQQGWQVGKTYNVTITVFGEKYTAPIQIIPDPIKKIEFNPIAVERLDGYWTEKWAWDEENQEEVLAGEYYCYPYIDSLETCKITLANGTTVTSDVVSEYGELYIVYEGKEYYLNWWDNQEQESWEVGNAYQVTVGVMGKSVPVSVTVKESNASKLTLDKNEVVTGPKFKYFAFTPEEDGTYMFESKGSLADPYVELCDGNNKYLVEADDEDGYNFKLTYDLEAGKTYYFHIGFYNSSADSCVVKLTKLEKFIENIEFHKTMLYQGIDIETDGYWRRYSDKISYTITFTDGTVKTFTGDRFEYDGDEYDLSWKHPGTDVEDWENGIYSVDIKLLGKEYQAPVEIAESPVDYVAVEPIVIHEYTNGYWDYGYDNQQMYYYEWYIDDLFKYTIYLKDGSEIKCSGREFEFEGAEYRTECYISNDQWENPWYAGNIYYEKIEVLGCEAVAEIEISQEYTEDGFEYLVQNGEAIITGVYFDFEPLEIPEELGGYPVTAIASIDEYLNSTEIIIPDSVTKLSDNMFQGNQSVEKITIGAGVEALNNKIFQNAYALKEINVVNTNPEYTSVDGIVYDKDVTKMIAIPAAKDTEHTVPATVTDIELYVKGGYGFDLNLANSNTGYVWEDGILYNSDKTVIYSCAPDKTGDYEMPSSVKEISQKAFYKSQLTSVEVSNSVKEIAYYTFAGSSDLEKVVLPDTLTSISYSAFENCYNLTDVNIPSALKTLNTGAFKNTAISSAVIPAGIKEIGSEAFYGTALENVTLPEGLKAIGAAAFERTKLTKVDLPDSLENIDAYAFYQTKIDSIEFGPNLFEIGDYAFFGTNISNVNIPNNVLMVGEYAFGGTPAKNIKLSEKATYLPEGTFYNTDITSVDIPDNVTDIAYRCFEDCENLMTIDLPTNLESLDYAFHGTKWYNSQPNGAVYLEKAFYHYKGTAGSEVYIKNGTEIIAGYAFNAQKNLKSVYIPKSVKSIGARLFNECDKIPTIYYEGTQSDRYKMRIDDEDIYNANWVYGACMHNWTNATCKAPKTCTKCKATIGAKLAHKPVKVLGGKATLKANGSILTKCSVCASTINSTAISKIASVTTTDKITYNGKTKTPAVTVKDSAGKVISSANYTVKYASGRKNYGKYKITVTFKGNYSGSKVIYFEIVPKNSKVSKLTAAKKSLKVKLSRQKSATGYQIQYSLKKDFKSAKTVTISKNSTTSKTISKLKAKKTYYVRVRTYKTVKGKKYYSDWSSAKSKKTK